MNKRTVQSWTDSVSECLFTDASDPTEIESQTEIVEVESETDEWTPIYVTAFVAPSGNPWAGPQMDFYIDTSTQVTGFVLQPGGGLYWCGSLVTTGTDPTNDFDDNVTGEELFDAWYCIDPDELAARLSWLPDVVDSSFFCTEPASSEIGLATIVSAGFDDGLLKLILNDQSGQYTVTVWIDIDTHEIVDSTSITPT